MRGLSRCSHLRLSSPLRISNQCCPRFKSTLVEVDSTGIPLKSTWSVNELLSSYPRPTITSSTLKRLHELSALIPPNEGTSEHATLTQEMEELVKLVEAVKLVDVSGVSEEGSVPDGRIWASGQGVELNAESFAVSEVSEASGRALLAHASRTMESLYVVETDKPRN